MILIVCESYPEYMQWMKKNFLYFTTSAYMKNNQFPYILPDDWNHEASAYERGTPYIHVSGPVSEYFENRFTEVKLVKEK